MVGETKSSWTKCAGAVALVVAHLKTGVAVAADTEVQAEKALAHAAATIDEAIVGDSNKDIGANVAAGDGNGAIVDIS